MLLDVLGRSLECGVYANVVVDLAMGMIELALKLARIGDRRRRTSLEGPREDAPQSRRVKRGENDLAARARVQRVALPDPIDRLDHMRGIDLQHDVKGLAAAQHDIPPVADGPLRHGGVQVQPGHQPAPEHDVERVGQPDELLGAQVLAARDRLAETIDDMRKRLRTSFEGLESERDRAQARARSNGKVHFGG